LLSLVTLSIYHGEKYNFCFYKNNRIWCLVYFGSSPIMYSCLCGSNYNDSINLKSFDGENSLIYWCFSS
jgi:hypothetical protein